MTSMRSDITPGERRNGWTPEALKKYLAERDNAVNGTHRLGAHSSDPEPLRILSANEAHDEHNW